MELMSGEEQEKQNKGKRIVIGAIVITVILIILVTVAILILKQTENNRLKLIADGKTVAINENFMLTDSNTGTTYLPIRQVAKLVNYAFYNGEYKKYSEDKTKCYVECQDELAMFELNSNVIYKNNAADKLNFDTYMIDQPVISYNNELYATPQAIQTAFNTRVTYQQTNKTIYLETLPYLVKYYQAQALKYGYTGISEDFITQKTLTQNLLVVKNNTKYGVVSTNNFATVIGNKYDSMTYLENTREFIVSNEGKSGILSMAGETKIDLRYNKIGLIDGQAGLYYAINNDRYGVLNQKGRVLVYIEYDNIGIDRTKFPLDNIKNNLFLYNNCIPLQKGKKWGLADKNGNIILNFEYDQLGYIEAQQEAEENGTNKNVTNTTNTVSGNTMQDRSINNVIVVPDIEGIVVGKNEQYGIVNSIGRLVVPCEFDKIYSITNEGKEEFYLEKDGRTTKLTQYLQDNKINVANPTENNTTNTTGTDITVNTNNMNDTADTSTNNTVATSTNTTGNTVKNAITTDNKTQE